MIGGIQHFYIHSLLLRLKWHGSGDCRVYVCGSIWWLMSDDESSEGNSSSAWPFGLVVCSILMLMCSILKTWCFGFVLVSSKGRFFFVLGSCLVFCFFLSLYPHFIFLLAISESSLYQHWPFLWVNILLSYVPMS